jgi:hypothetical protein
MTLATTYLHNGFEHNGTLPENSAIIEAVVVRHWRSRLGGNQWPGGSGSTPLNNDVSFCCGAWRLIKQPLEEEFVNVL